MYKSELGDIRRLTCTMKWKEHGDKKVCVTMPRKSQTTAISDRRAHEEDIFTGQWPEGPPDHKMVSMIEALVPEKAAPEVENSTTIMCHQREWLQGCDRELPDKATAGNHKRRKHVKLLSPPFVVEEIALP